MLISNIKCSCIIEVSEKWKHEIKQICETNRLFFQERGNIFIIKYCFSLCIIQRKRNIKEKLFIHMNITGNRNFSVLKTNLKFIFRKLLHPTWRVDNITIDNICATFKYFKSINLKLLNSVLQISTLNFERFPAVFYKKNCATYLIFENGKVNILGCKNVKDIKLAWRHIYPFLTYSDK